MYLCQTNCGCLMTQHQHTPMLILKELSIKFALQFYLISIFLRFFHIWVSNRSSNIIAIEIRHESSISHLKPNSHLNKFHCKRLQLISCNKGLSFNDDTVSRRVGLSRRQKNYPNLRDVIYGYPQESFLNDVYYRRGEYSKCFSYNKFWNII